MEDTCKLNHTMEDVRQKYESQKTFLPTNMHSSFETFFNQEHTQELLNDVFHLLKKYDLASEEEKDHRNNRLNMVLDNL